MCAEGVQRRGWQDPAPRGVLRGTAHGWEVPASQGHPSGKGQRVENLLVPGAGPSEGLLLLALPSDLGCSVPETGWMVDREDAKLSGCFLGRAEALPQGVFPASMLT